MFRFIRKALFVLLVGLVLVGVVHVLRAVPLFFTLLVWAFLAYTGWRASPGICADFARLRSGRLWRSSRVGGDVL